MSVKGTRTERNILAAFAGESQARNKYSMFAEVAREAGLEQIATIFEETANQEKAHAKRLFSFLDSGSDVVLDAAYPAGRIGTTLENLKAAAAGENYEHVTMYPDFAAEAEKEGFKNIAVAMRSIAVAEKHHEDRYNRLAERVSSGFFERNTDVSWECLNCGYLHTGKTAPNKCPACGVNQQYFQLQRANWLD